MDVPIARVQASGQQTLSEPEAKAAFLLNFARFTQWPEVQARAALPLTMCAADDLVLAALRTTVDGRKAGGRPVAIQTFGSGEVDPVCDLLYLGGLDRRRVARALRAVGRTPVLTVGDQDGFALLGGMIELFREDGRMGFVINRTTAEAAGLRLSSRLLELGRPASD
jgi:hypothetical protein